MERRGGEESGKYFTEIKGGKDESEERRGGSRSASHQTLFKTGPVNYSLPSTTGWGRTLIAR